MAYKEKKGGGMAVTIFVPTEVCQSELLTSKVSKEESSVNVLALVLLNPKAPEKLVYQSHGMPPEKPIILPKPVPVDIKYNEDFHKKIINNKQLLNVIKEECAMIVNLHVELSKYYFMKKTGIEVDGDENLRCRFSDEAQRYIEYFKEVIDVFRQINDYAERFIYVSFFPRELIDYISNFSSNVENYFLPILNVLLENLKNKIPMFYRENSKKTLPMCIGLYKICYRLFNGENISVDELDSLKPDIRYPRLHRIFYEKLFPDRESDVKNIIGKMTDLINIRMFGSIPRDIQGEDFMEHVDTVPVTNSGPYDLFRALKRHVDVFQLNLERRQRQYYHHLRR